MLRICLTHGLALLSHYFKSITCVCSPGRPLRANGGDCKVDGGIWTELGLEDMVEHEEGTEEWDEGGEKDSRSDESGSSLDRLDSDSGDSGSGSGSEGVPAQTRGAKVCGGQ